MTREERVRAGAAAYVAFFETLSPNSLQDLDDLCSADVRFRDPFNDVTGTERFRAVLAKMFRDVADPRFEVTDRATSGQTCYLRWVFTFRSGGPSGRHQRIDGVSEIQFDVTGKVIAHLDYWDPGAHVYERIPLLGALVRIVRRRLSAGV